MEGWDLWIRLALLGRFALLERQTIVVQATQGSLTERSARSGEYMRAIATLATIVVDLAGRVAQREDHACLRARAAGLEAYLEALGALARDNRELARTMLVAACAGLPELSREPQLVANRLALLRFGPHARLQSFGSAAAVWPNARADTALYLRFHALVLALRLGRGGEAARLLLDWPFGATPRFVVRRAFQKRLYRGEESPMRPTTVRSICR